MNLGEGIPVEFDAIPGFMQSPFLRRRFRGGSGDTEGKDMAVVIKDRFLMSRRLLDFAKSIVELSMSSKGLYGSSTLSN
jgi:hypothetical protein